MKQQQKGWFAALAKPAQRALSAAGITSLQQFTKFTESEVAHLHGIGPNAVKSIKKAMAGSGLAFSKKKK